jgi:hypothetical protein
VLYERIKYQSEGEAVGPYVCINSYKLPFTLSFEVCIPSNSIGKLDNRVTRVTDLHRYPGPWKYSPPNKLGGRVVIQERYPSLEDCSRGILLSSTRNFLTFLNATDIAYHTKIRQDPDFGCMQ